ncbi:hypothetical protein GGR56DRAFT_612775 [Xylariaceae sp. FL0804]|nr:hypothetical protein GGR56DRAFT_612775 [Xylariaceae sp. FL0804]
MAGAPVLCFPVSGQENGSFLLEVSSNGSRPLDLKLIGSEGGAVFTTKLRHKRIDEHRAASGHCADEEWASILASTLVDQQPVPDVEIRADVQTGGSSVALSFRKNIQGITQRLGLIKLAADDTTEISPFDWCVSAIAAKARVAEDLAAATAKVTALEESADELKRQLDELIRAKDEDETLMLEKFRDLLNEKKLKIRQQQRLLASASVDPDKLANAGAGHATQRRVAAGASRGQKRKAVIKEESDSSDDGFERMEVDGAEGSGDASSPAQPESDDDNSQGASTEDDTPSEADSEEAEPAPLATRSRTAADAVPPRRSARGASQQDTPASSPPPKRVVPFQKGRKTAPPPPKAADDDDETESDDEL